MPEFLGAQLTNPQALWLSALIIPVVILYILKPKPKSMKFPSVMFIELIEKSHRLRGFLEKIIRDPLLFLQILLLVVFALLLSDPQLNLREAVRQKENVVYVLDASASMAATDEYPTRFKKAVDMVLESAAQLHPDSKVSLVVSSVSPLQVLASADADQLSATLNNLQPIEASSNLADALFLASDLRSPENPNRVLVVSDFAQEPTSVDSAVALLKNRGFKVDLLTVGDSAENIGIVGCSMQRKLLTENQVSGILALSNFGFEKKQFKVNLLDQSKLLKSYGVELKPGGREVIELSAQTELSAKKLRVVAETQDKLSLDDTCYYYLPEVKVSKVLLLSDEDSDQYLKLLLESLPHVEYQVAVPPVIPPVAGFDLIIMSDVAAEKILPGTFRDIQEHVSNGASFIAVSSDALDDVKSSVFWGMMGFEITGLDQTQTPVVSVSDHPVLDSTSFANTVVEKHYKVNTSLTPLLSASDTPLLCLKPIGSGFTVYFGLNPDPEFSNFHLSSSYPILVSQLINFLSLGGEEAENNLLSGQTLIFEDHRRVVTPKNSILNTSFLVLDETGFYETPNIYSASLIDPSESDLTPKNVSGAFDASLFNPKVQEIEVSRDLRLPAIALILLLILIEAVTYRSRGVI